MYTFMTEINFSTNTYICSLDYTYWGSDPITAAHIPLNSQITLGLHIKHFQSSFSAATNKWLTFLFIHL